MIRAALLSFLVVGWNGLCHGGVVVFAPDVTVQSQPTSSVTGYFEVYFTYAAPSDPAAFIDGWQIGLSLSPSAGRVSFSGAAVVTSNHSMLFSNNFASPTGGGSNSATYVSAYADNGTLLVNGPDVEVTNGAGIMRVPFTVSAGTTGTFDLTVDTEPVFGTILTNKAYENVTYSAHDGSITVTAAPTAVPLPPAVLAGGGLMGLLGVRRWWRSRTNPLG